MALDERFRHALHFKLEKVLGKEALTLMELTPPPGWADVATKGELRDLKQEVREEFRDLRRQIDGHFRTTIFSLLAAFVALGSLILATLELG